jgi:hypothetical protein
VTLIDQRILIPAPVQIVWTVVANHSLLPRWRVECKAVSLLSTRPDGPGVRRRITQVRGKDIIEETTAWYEGLGYEYRLIEGSKFKSYVARLRLQPTPDGTIVQSTIAFETRGLLGRFLGNHRRRRKLERRTAESLRQLRRLIEEMDVKIDDYYRERTTTRPAPESSYRLQYGAILFSQEQAQLAQAAQPASRQETVGRLVEPPVKPDDTPNVPMVKPPSFILEALQTPVTPTTAAPPPAEKARSALPAETRAQDAGEDTQPNLPLILGEPPKPLEQASTPEKRAIGPSRQTPRPPTSLPETGLLASPDASELEAALATNKIAIPSPPHQLSADEVEGRLPRRPDLPAPTEKRDTGEISIWEVFGIARPTEASPEPAKSDSPVSPAPPHAPGSTGAHTAARESKTLSLDAWLAANEPPLPASASGTIKTLARPPQPPRFGLRRQQRQHRLRVRPPRKLSRPSDQV